MPRKRKAARLWLKPAQKDRAAVWIILDGGKQTSTSCSEGNRVEAERELARYITRQYTAEPKSKHRGASEVPVAEVISAYSAVKETTVKRPAELGARIDKLLDFWGDKMMDEITSATCIQYAKQRTTENQARRELEDLRAACRMAIADNICRHEVIVTLPPKPRGRVRHLERAAIAKLIWAAYRKRAIYKGSYVTTKGKPNKKRPTLHVARFLLTALYTGSRSGRVWQASFEKEDGRPWADLDNGIFYRTWEGEIVADNKRAPAIRIPGRLLAHMRRWRKMGAKYIVEFEGRAADPKIAFRRLVKDVLGKDGADVVRHTLRHTAATWLMQAGESKYEAAGFLGMTEEMLDETYGHHHPDHQSSVGDAFTSGRAGRKKTPENPPEKPRQ